ncbi:MAG: AI-2E family transporter, partial [Myxococcaceae bacterium]
LEFGPVQALLTRAGEFTSLSKDQILKEAIETAQGALQQVASLGGTVVVGAFNVITQFSLTMFLLFFFLRDGKGMLERGIRLVPMTPARKIELAGTLGGVTRAVVLGTAVTALVQGPLGGIGFAIAGLPSPLVFGAVGAIASLIPIVGTSLVWVPAVITLIAQGQTGWAVFLTLWSIILVAGSDNVVRPLIISGSSKASTLLVFVGLLGGISVFGFAGIFMGPLVLTLVATLLEYADLELPRASAMGLGSLPPLPSPPSSIAQFTKDAITEPPSVPPPAPPAPVPPATAAAHGELPPKAETKMDKVE